MAYLKWLAVTTAIAITIPLLAIAAFTLWPTSSESDLSATERDVLRSIRALDLNVSVADYFSCSFNARARVCLLRNGDEGRCHVVRFELLQASAAPVGAKQLQDIISDSTERKLVNELVKCRYLERVIVPGASATSLARLRRALPQCLVSADLADAQSASAKVIYDAINRRR